MGSRSRTAIFEPLTAFDADLVPQPWLAESVTPNAAFTSYQIKLRPGIVFSDGTDFDARRWSS